MRSRRGGSAVAGPELGWRPTSGVREVLAVVIVTVAATALPADLEAQVREAIQPRPGELWFEVSPSLLDWTERFGESGRVPLAADLDGPIAERIYPGVEPLLDDLNADAAALGFDPLAPSDFALGSLDVGVVSAQVRRIDARLEVGVLDRLSVEVGAPAVFTEVEPLFGFDPTAATLAPGQLVVSNAGSFFGGVESARSALEDRIETGELTPEEEAEARALLQTSGAFLEAFQRRVAQNRLVPLGGSPAGMAIAARYASLGEGFAGFELTLPELELLDELAAADLEALLGAAPIGSAAPRTVENGWGVPHVDLGVRFGVLDRTTGDPGPVRYRTTLGARVRFPLGETLGRQGGTFLPLEIPIGRDGGAVEVTAQQALHLGETFRVDAAARYALRMASTRTGRVFAPGRPIALALTESVIERDPGNLFELKAVPQANLNPYLAIGLAYGFEGWGEDAVRIVDGSEAIEDAEALESGTAGTRHRLGLSVFLRTAEDLGARWRLAFTVQSALAGTGTRTPASRLVSFSIRAPLQLF